MPAQTRTQPLVLVVEDNQETQLLLRHLLQSKFSVEIANNGVSALEHARDNEYKLILMDINLGDDEDGIDIHRQIREIDRHTQTPIIALTAYALPGDRERFVQAGFDGYLSKPFTRRQLLATVDEVMGALDD